MQLCVQQYKFQLQYFRCWQLFVANICVDMIVVMLRHASLTFNVFRIFLNLRMWRFGRKRVRNTSVLRIASVASVRVFSVILKINKHFLERAYFDYHRVSYLNENDHSEWDCYVQSHTSYLLPWQQTSSAHKLTKYCFATFFPAWINAEVIFIFLCVQF